MVRFLYPMSANCLHTKTMFFHVSDRAFFPPNFRKFAVENERISEFPQTFQNLGFLEIKIDFFERKLWIFQKLSMWHICFGTRLKKIISWKCISTLIVGFFRPKIRTFLKQKTWKRWWRKSILKKQVFSLLTGIFNKVGGIKTSQW